MTTQMNLLDVFKQLKTRESAKSFLDGKFIVMLESIDNEPEETLKFEVVGKPTSEGGTGQKLVGVFNTKESAISFSEGIDFFIENDMSGERLSILFKSKEEKNAFLIQQEQSRKMMERLRKEQGVELGGSVSMSLDDDMMDNHQFIDLVTIWECGFEDDLFGDMVLFTYFRE